MRARELGKSGERVATSVRATQSRPRRRVGHPGNPEPDVATRATRVRTGAMRRQKGTPCSNLGSSLATFSSG